MKISSPDTTYTGESRYGETVLNFEDGVATFDGDLPEGVRQYMVGAGYSFGSKRPDELEADVPADPRDVTNVRSGTPLRDAAVDPRDGDFLVPTNAGVEGPLGNPHGPTVVSPQIHGSVGQAVVPGPVGTYHEEDVTDEDGKVTGKVGVVVSDTAVQEARETEFAERALVGNEPVPEVLEEMGKAANPAGADPTRESPDEALDLKGAALDDALAEVGLSKAGTADEKRARLAEYRGGAA